MADQEKIPANNISADEDTRTRKTVRLRTLVPSATGPNLDGVASTASSQKSTALEGAEDTRTRSTVPLIPNTPPPAPTTPVISEGEDTRTRVTVKLKPAMATAPLIPPAEPAPAPAPAPAAPAASEGEDTRTRVTVKLKPAMATAPTIPAPAPAAAVAEPAAKVEEDDDTKTRRNAVLPAAAPTSANVAADDDRTVRIQRPALKKPTVSAPAPAPTAPKTPVLPVVPETAAPAPEAPKAAAVPPKAVPPKPPVSPMPTQMLTSPMPAVPTASEAEINIPLPPKESRERPSALYTVVTLISLLLLLGSATLGVVHYLNFSHKMNIELPGIPFGK